MTLCWSQVSYASSRPFVALRWTVNWHAFLAKVEAAFSASTSSSISRRTTTTCERSAWSTWTSTKTNWVSTRRPSAAFRCNTQRFLHVTQITLKPNRSPRSSATFATWSWCQRLLKTLMLSSTAPRSLIFNFRWTRQSWSASTSTVRLPPLNRKRLMQFSICSIAGTKNVVNLCIKYNVPRLIYTSCASVTLRPYLGQAPFAVVVNQTESKIRPSLTGKSLIIPGYSQTKLRAEMIVLGAHGTNLSNGTGSTASFAIHFSYSAAA